jgi:hypothetical protein
MTLLFRSRLITPIILAGSLLASGFALAQDSPRLPLQVPFGGDDILTPAPGPAPRINGPLVYGCRPGNPFLYRIPCTGERPILFLAVNLPSSLRLDRGTGIISGITPLKGEYAVTLRARNPHGNSERRFRIVSGDRLALTPPHGVEPLVRALLEDY